MLRTIISYGVVAGVIVGVPLFGITVAMQGHAVSPWAAVAGYLTMLVALSTIFVAVKRRRDVDLGGAIRFWPAFGMGLAISAVAGIFYVAAWRDRRGAGELHRRYGTVEGAVRQPALPRADDLCGDLAGRRARIPGLGGTLAKQTLLARTAVISRRR